MARPLQFDRKLALNAAIEFFRKLAAAVARRDAHKLRQPSVIKPSYLKK
jgi:hypothetical protein